MAWTNITMATSTFYCASLYNHISLFLSLSPISIKEHIDNILTLFIQHFYPTLTFWHFAHPKAILNVYE